MAPKGSGRGTKTKLPVATVAYYGPDDKVSTKVAVGIIEQLGKEPIELRRWAGKDVVNDPQVVKEVADFIRQHRAKRVVVTDGNMGCPHEEAIDFPIGKDCPYCPFWQGKQGTARGKGYQVKASGSG